MAARDLLAQMMARKRSHGPTPRVPTIDEIIAAGSQPEPPPMQGPPVPPVWHPGPTSPWGGLQVFDWKNPEQRPLALGTVDRGPGQQDLQLLHLLGRRRMSPALSGVGELRD
jgi:hypothetical protein